MSAGDYLLHSINDVVTERMRQIEEEGYNAQGDDRYGGGELACAGGCYAFYAAYKLAELNGVELGPITGVPKWWPWDDAWWKPGDTRKNLVKAAALVMAEIDRYDRKHGTGNPANSGVGTHGSNKAGADGASVPPQEGSGSTTGAEEVS